jgi:hypothetical protein
MAITLRPAPTSLPHPLGVVGRLLDRAGTWFVKARAPTLASLTALTLLAASCAEFNIKDAQILGRTLGYVGDGASGPAIHFLQALRMLVSEK